MAIEERKILRKVLRDEKPTRQKLDEALLSRQLGLESENNNIGIKTTNGDMVWFTPEEGDAIFSNLKLTGFDESGALVVDGNGVVSVTTSSGGGTNSSKFKTSASDTTEGYSGAKIVGGEGITTEIVKDLGDDSETLKITSTDGIEEVLINNSNANGQGIEGLGNVGIGTDTPASSLEVSKNDKANGATISITNAHQGAWSAEDRIGGIDFRVNDASTTVPVRASIEVVSDAASTYPIFPSIRFNIARQNISKEVMRIDGNTRNVGIGTSSPSSLLDINSDIVRLRTAKTPASATATGNAGDICWDSSYIYVCTATNTWKRTAIATW